MADVIRTIPPSGRGMRASHDRSGGWVSMRSNAQRCSTILGWMVPRAWFPWRAEGRAPVFPTLCAGPETAGGQLRRCARYPGAQLTPSILAPAQLNHLLHSPRYAREGNPLPPNLQRRALEPPIFDAMHRTDIITSSIPHRIEFICCMIASMQLDGSRNPCVR